MIPSSFAKYSHEPRLYPSFNLAVTRAEARWLILCKQTCFSDYCFVLSLNHGDNSIPSKAIWHPVHSTVSTRHSSPNCPLSFSQVLFGTQFIVGTDGTSFGVTVCGFGLTQFNEKSYGYPGGLRLKKTLGWIELCTVYISQSKAVFLEWTNKGAIVLPMFWFSHAVLLFICAISNVF